MEVQNHKWRTILAINSHHEPSFAIPYADVPFFLIPNAIVLGHICTRTFLMLSFLFYCFFSPWEVYFIFFCCSATMDFFILFFTWWIHGSRAMCTHESIADFFHLSIVSNLSKAAGSCRCVPDFYWDGGRAGHSFPRFTRQKWCGSPSPLIFANQQLVVSERFISSHPGWEPVGEPVSGSLYTNMLKISTVPF